MSYFLITAQYEMRPADAEGRDELVDRLQNGRESGLMPVVVSSTLVNEANES